MPEENFRNHNVLVIGGAGYVGSVLVGKLLQEEARVRVLNHLLYDNGFALQHCFDEPDFSFVNDDFCDGDVVSRAMDDVTDVVLLGSLVGDPICKRYPELAVMVNRDASLRLVDAMAAQGVTRASIGVQDFNPHVQWAVNRIQSFECVADAVAALRQAGVGRINFDLMYGLPHQTVADVEAAMEILF